jgi:hypothetical protein
MLIPQFDSSKHLNDEMIESPELMSVRPTHSLKLDLLISPIPVHNSVHNRFIVTETLPGFR